MASLAEFPILRSFPDSGYNADKITGLRNPSPGYPTTQKLDATTGIKREIAYMDGKKRKVQGLQPNAEVMTKQRLPYFVGISGQSVGAQGLSMHLVVIPPGARAEPHVHIGYETGIYVLEGRVCTRWGASLENEIISEAGEFLFIPPGVPHEAINLSASKVARAVVARNDPAEQDNVEPYVVSSTSKSET